MINDKVDDAVLIERASAGDRHAFDALVVKHRHRLTRSISRFVQDSGDVEDIIQDTFIKAWRSLSNFRTECAFYTWIYRIAINTTKNYGTSRKRQTTRTVAFTDESACSAGLFDIDTPESVLASKQVASTINDSINAMPQEFQVAIILRDLDGLTYAQIAMIMSCPVGTVRGRIFRAREAVSRKLKGLLDVPDRKRW